MSAQVIPIRSAACRIRAMVPGDRDRLHAMLRRCSRQTLYARFLSHSDTAADAYVQAVFTDAACYSAVVERGAEVVAEGSLFFDGPHRAEIALLVQDDSQGRGVGALLAEHLCGYAARRGVRRLELTTLTGNTRIIRLFRRSVSGAEFGPPDAGTVTSTLRLAA